MRLKYIGSVLLAVLVAPCAPASADSVIQFTDGRFLRVASCEVADGWVRITLKRNDDTFMLFPVDRVEHVERNGRMLFAREVGGSAGSQPATASVEPQAPVRRAASVRPDPRPSS